MFLACCLVSCKYMDVTNKICQNLGQMEKEHVCRSASVSVALWSNGRGTQVV